VAAAVRLCLRGLVLLALALSALPGGRTTAAQPDDIPALFFGVIGAYAAPYDARLLGATWEQVTFPWAHLQPDGPGDLDPAAVPAAWLEDAASAGREVTGLITTTPAWASAGGSPAAVPDGLALPLDDPGNVWAAFVRQLVAEYAPQGVHHWTIYDQPNVRPGEGPVQFAGDVTAYAQMVRVAALAARGVDPNAVIHVAAVDWWADVAAGRDPYLARLLRALAADPDAPAQGYYFGVVDVRALDVTQAVWDIVTAHRAILTEAGLGDKALWLEANARPSRDPAGPGQAVLFGITPEQQADFIVQAAALGMAAGVERFTVSRLVDAPGDGLPEGLLRLDGSRRPAFAAYQTVIDLFAPGMAAARYENEASEVIVLSVARREVFVMWARAAGPVQVTITAPQVGERATLTMPPGWFRGVQAVPFDWPAAYTLELAAARRDTNGFLSVAGSPRILDLPPSGDFFRVVYVQADGGRIRVK
jgi:hypothetical protein